MPDLVRIRDPKTKTEYSVGARRAEQLVERGAELVKDGDATDRLGRALPASETTAPAASGTEPSGEPESAPSTSTTTKSKTASKESTR